MWVLGEEGRERRGGEEEQREEEREACYIVFPAI